MRIGYYCPLKPPDHPTPSGDRRIARGLRRLLWSRGFEVSLQSELRSYVKDGGIEAQQTIARAAAAEAARIAQQWRIDPTLIPAAWLTYHCYHKAPDHLGPQLCTGFNLPYLIIEPSRSAKQATGPWAFGFEASERAFERADRLLPVTAKDRTGLEAVTGFAGKITEFPPFLDMMPYLTANKPALRSTIAGKYGLDPARPWIITVAMMRRDVKEQSYRSLIEILAGLNRSHFTWIAVGDGPARLELEGLAAQKLGHAARFVGLQQGSDLQALYAASDIFAWPAFNEAYGMAILEAQAAGLPCLTFLEGGVDAVMRDGQTGYAIEGRSLDRFKQTLNDLIERAPRRQKLGAQAKAYALAKHDAAAAADHLRTIILASTGGQTCVKS